MAKFTFNNALLSASNFVSSVVVPSITLLDTSPLTVGGVSGVIGTAGADTVSLNVPASFLTAGFTPASVATFSLDTKTTGKNIIDVVSGSTGDDVVLLSNSASLGYVNASYKSNGGFDDLSLTANSDTLTFKTAFDGNISLNGGNDTVSASSFADSFNFSPDLTHALNLKFSSNGVLYDDILATANADVITLSSPSRIVYQGNAGIDSINGSSGRDYITIDSTMPVLNSPVRIDAGYGSDVIILSTISSNDRLIYTSVNESSPTSRDIVTNFDAATSSTAADKIQFNNLDKGTVALLPVGNAFTGDGINSEIAIQASGSNTLISVDFSADGNADFAVMLMGVSPSNVDMSDFAFV